MAFYFDTNKFEVEKFYSYPSVVVLRVAEYSEYGLHNGVSNKYIRTFFEDVLKYVENKLGRKLMDNKIAFKVRYKESNSVLYVGYKDDIWTIGLSMNPNSKATYELNLNKK